jgi:hypothetical protein
LRQKRTCLVYLAPAEAPDLAAPTGKAQLQPKKPDFAASSGKRGQLIRGLFDNKTM